jgi:hypothetical protein
MTTTLLIIGGVVVFCILTITLVTISNKKYPYPDEHRFCKEHKTPNFECLEEHKLDRLIEDNKGKRHHDSISKRKQRIRLDE